MTEYKKLITLSETLAADVATLCGSGLINSQDADNEEAGAVQTGAPNASDSLEELHALATRIRDAVADGYPRLRKIVLKAREKDPNRQIYNEAMCKKIEALFTAFCAALKQLAPGFPSGRQSTENGVASEHTKDEEANPFEAVLKEDFAPAALFEDSPALQKEDDVHNQHILQRAKEEAWQSRVAQGLSDVVLFEEQGRSLIVAEEKCCRAALAEEKRVDKVRIVRLLEEREAAKWNEELRRRKEELDSLQARTEQIRNVADVPSALQQMIMDTSIRLKLADHARQLIRALLSTPDDVNIRRLRNNNEHLTCDYGHPCLVASSAESGESCACHNIVVAAEMLWCRMGFTIRYTNAPNRSIEVLMLEKRAGTLLLPCRRPMSKHAYTSMGFEDYSERYFELMEPNAFGDADAWMEWYNAMQQMCDVLTGMLPR